MSQGFDDTKSLTAEIDGAVTLRVRASKVEPGAVFHDAVILQRDCLMVKGRILPRARGQWVYMYSTRGKRRRENVFACKASAQKLNVDFLAVNSGR